MRPDDLFPDDESARFDRRELLAQLGLVLGALGAGAALSACKDAPRPEHPHAHAGQGDAGAGDAGGTAAKAAKAARPVEHAFLPPQRQTFEAAVWRVLPSDQDPGAKEANVIEYIDRELTRPEVAKIKKAMLAGLVALDNYARRLGGKRFVELAAEEQDDILHQIQRASDRGRDFVKFLVLLTLEGFVSDPMYGGNLGGVGWSFIGYGPGNPDGSGKGAHGRHGAHH